MDILLYNEGDEANIWMRQLQSALPGANVRLWSQGDHAPADYVVAWRPPHAVFERTIRRAVFNLGAGVDAILQSLHSHPPLLSEKVPIIRLEDCGMARQMAHYVLYAVLRHYRRFDAYDEHQRQGCWRPLPPLPLNEHAIGILGVGSIGKAVAFALRDNGFEVRTWSRRKYAYEGIESYAGSPDFDAFLDKLSVVVNVLPLTSETAGILNSKTFGKLNAGAQIINVGRGAHLVESDLLHALDSGQVGSAFLDVFHDEPPKSDHPFWRHPKIHMTPHIAAVTLIDGSVAQIRLKIETMESGKPVTGIVDRALGY